MKWLAASVEMPEPELDYPDDDDEDEQEELDRLERVAAGLEHVCVGCGCSDSRPCPGGCIWATETLCSRCV